MDKNYSPRPNLNGTEKWQLIDQNNEVRHAIDQVIGKMAAAMPHGRDFQINPDPRMDFSAARDRHLDRLRRLEAIKEEYDEIVQTLAGAAF